MFGGSGFLGRQIVKCLASDGAAVRVAVRHPERASYLTDLGTAGLITTVPADVWDEATVAPAIHASDAVVNTVGHYVERGRATFEAIHGQGALHVARASAKAGVKRLVHISGIGADAGSPSAYVRARAVGERLVTQAFPEATILRPSVMFGPEDAFFNQLAALVRVMPVLPLFGSGAVKLQPVYVGDVAEAVARSLASEVAKGKTYELGGPILPMSGGRGPLSLTRPVWESCPVGRSTSILRIHHLRRLFPQAAIAAGRAAARYNLYTVGAAAGDVNWFIGRWAGPASC